MVLADRAEAWGSPDTPEAAGPDNRAEADTAAGERHRRAAAGRVRLGTTAEDTREEHCTAVAELRPVRVHMPAAVEVQQVQHKGTAAERLVPFGKAREHRPEPERLALLVR